MNKFALVAVITFSNFLLCGQDKPIKITALHAPEVLLAVSDQIDNDRLKQKDESIEQLHSGKTIGNRKPAVVTVTYNSKEECLKHLKETRPEMYELMMANEAKYQDEKSPELSLIKPFQWLLESSMDNAPKLVKGIVFYLLSRKKCTDRLERSMAVTSFHRFILVGPPGTGKTTLAHAIAHALNYPVVFIPATSLLGHFRNETANNIQKMVKEYTSDRLPKVLIIDELHKLFEQHADSRTDDSQNAATFWLALDSIEKSNPNIIIIGTANSVEKLPPEIKSRFSGKIITMPPLDKNQKVQTFKNSIAHDQSVVVDGSVDNAFITRMLQQIQDCSLRDVQLIIDSAKMFNYAQQSIEAIQLPIVLTCANFQQALDQLQAESQVLQESILERFYQKINKWGVVLSAAANVVTLIKAANSLLNKTA